MATAASSGALVSNVESATVAAPTATSTPPISPASPTPYPTLPPDAIIKLLGPPTDSGFRLGDTVSFYGRWPYPLIEGQSLAVYIRLNGQETRLGMLDEPNIGRDYRWQVELEALTDTAVTVEWLVRLESDSLSPPLAESERRTFTILP